MRVPQPVVLVCVVEWPLPVEEWVVRHKFPDIDEDVEVRCYIFRYSGLCIGLGCREDVDIRAILAQLKIEFAIVHRIALQQGEPVFFREFHCRSEEHTSELQSLMRISYAVFCLKKQKTQNKNTHVNKLK